MNTPRIASYHFGNIVIDGKSYTQDVIILPDRVIGKWWRMEGHRLQIEDLQIVLETRPEVLIVGQGAYGRMDVPEETQGALQSAGIEMIALPTEKACRAYNSMRAGRRVAAALNVTC